VEAFSGAARGLAFARTIELLVREPWLRCQGLETGVDRVPAVILRFVHTAFVCLLSLMLTGLPGLVAADTCVRASAEQHAEDDSRGEDRSTGTPWDAYRAVRLCAQAPCPALPQEAAQPTVTRLSLRWSMERTAIPCIGTPQEVFQPPRQA